MNNNPMNNRLLMNNNPMNNRPPMNNNPMNNRPPMNNNPMNNNPMNNRPPMNKLTSKHILFYSNFCQFSNDIYKTIEKYNIKNKFILINISQKKYKIPTIIKTVPTILLNDKKTILMNDKIDTFLENLSQKTNEKVDPFTSLTGISNGYSFLDDNSNKDTTLNFGLINSEFHIETPSEDGGGANSGSISDKMNNMQEQRNVDIQQYFKKT